MTAGLEWLPAFPLTEAVQAVQAIQRSWEHWASHRRDHFHHRIAEPKLTKVIRQHTERVTGRDLGLLGYWSAEPVDNEIDADTGEILEETRSDIIYAWNDTDRSMQLVFEFKKVTHTDSSRKYYLGEKGLQRFITGRYSRQQAVAIMVGILMSDDEVIVSGLQKSLQNPGNIAALRMLRRDDGAWLHLPSALFPFFAKFDTEHERVPELAPSHGTIRVSHAFVGFCFPSDPAKKRSSRKKTLEGLE